MKTNRLIFCLLLLGVLAPWRCFSATPIKDLKVSGTSEQTSGTFTIQTGVVWTAASGSTVNLSAATLTLGTGQIGWTAVSKTGSSLADLATRSASDLSSGTLPDARFPASLPAIGGSALVWADGVRVTFNPNGTAAGINVGAQAGDPSTPVNGDLWYDSTANELTARINGANVALGAGGGGGGSTFTSLTDAPSSYSGAGGKAVAVKGDASGLEFVDAALPAWLSAHPDAPPASPNALDDEFNDAATLPGGGSAKWAWNNQQSATATIGGGRLQLASPTYSNTILFVQTISGNFDVRAKITRNYTAANYNDAGLFVGDSATGRHMAVITAIDATQVDVQKWDSTTSYSSQPAQIALMQAPTAYYRIVRDSTNLTFYFSNEGTQWIQLFQEARATYLTGGQDRVGLRIRPNGVAVAVAVEWFRVQ